MPVPDWSQDIPEFIQAIKNDVSQDKKHKSNTIIGKAGVKMIETYKKHGKDIQEYMVDFLDAMMMEHQRRIQKTILTEEQLIDLHNKSFRGAHDIFLCALWSKNNAKDIQELPQILWRLYGIMDLQKDLSKNICNIPKEIGIDIPVNKQDFETLLNNKEVQQWITKTIEAQKANIEIVRWKYNLLDKPARVLCEWLLPELDTFINNFNYEEYKKSQLLKKW